MSLVINSNIASLNALRNMNRSQDSLATSLQRLSSGLRINSAKDDASGLAIAEGLTTKIRGNKQAIRNASDGISLGQTAETALGQVAAYLQRAREITIQSANGSIGDNNRAQLQKEVDQLTQEASRIVQTTAFNGTALLSGSSTLTFQVGYEGVSNNQVAITTTDLTGLQGPASTLYEGVAITGYAQAAAADDGIKDLAINGVAIKGPDISGVYERFNPDTSALERATELATAINSFTGSTGVRAELNSTNDGVNLISDTGTDIIVSSDTQSASDIRNWFGLELGTYTSTTNPGTPSVLTSYNSNLSETGTIDISTQANATAALTRLDADISKITNTRATFGALQNRFEAVIANLQANEESYTAARSRIQDADFATETANLTRNQILQQAGISILSQANSIPQIALSLLS